MKNLEEKIVGRIYKYETRRTISDIVLQVTAILSTFLLSVFVFQIIYKTLYEQRTLDVLQIFQEDREVIGQYIGDVIETLSFELPKVPIGIFIVSTVCFAILALYFLRNFGKILTKIKSLIRYYRR